MRSWLRRHGDGVVAVVLGGGYLVTALRATGQHSLPAWWGVVAGSALVLRRRAPLASYLVVLVSYVVAAEGSPAFADGPFFVLLVLMFSLYSLGAHARGTEAWLGGAALVPAVVVLDSYDGDHSVGGIFFFCMMCALPWGAGLALRLRLDQVRESEARHAALRKEAERAVSDERLRIARELHDVVSHAIAVTVLQSRGAKKLVDRDDAAVRDALLAIEHTNTAALADMRRLLTLLRSQDAGPGDRDEPAPTLERLDRLVEQVRSSGLPVDLSVIGEPLPVPPGLDLSAYRIVQEALTNVLKHGGPGARARVEVRYEPDALAVAVTNTGVVVVGGATGGHGLIGIRERVTVAGGTVEVGPSDDGFALRATLPYMMAPVP